MPRVVAIPITIIMHASRMMARTCAPVTSRSPVVAVAVTVVPVIAAVVDIVAVVNMQTRPTIVVITGIVVPVIRVTPVTVVMHVKVIGQPTNGERRCDTPEISRVKGIAVRVRVVVDRIGPRIIVIDRPWLVDDDMLGFIVRNVNHVLFDRFDLDYAILVADRLTLIRFQIAGSIGLVAKRLDGGNDVRLLSDYGFAEPPGPVDILVHQFDDLGIIKKCCNGLVPVLIGF
jgi:hypothetical protein